MTRHVVLAGGSGLLGRALGRRLVAAGARVTILGRTARAASQNKTETITHVAWTPDGSAGPWGRALEDVDVVVNLAGAGMADRRWTPARKALLESSRLLSTESLVKAVASSPARPSIFVQGSAVGYYGATLEDRTFDESAPAGTDFLGDLCRRWEAAAEPVAALGCRLVTVRTGVVLDPNGGALPQMALPFKLFGGGPVGSGRQMLSWIHRDDWTKLLCWLIETPAAVGAFNASAPTPLPNREFSRALGQALGRPSWVPAPGFALKIALGEMAEALLLRGQRVVPARALAMGFRFDYPTIDAALQQIYRG